MFTVGVNFSHHCSVALLKNNEVVFFSLEERYKREKEWGGKPNLVPTSCLDEISKFTREVDVFTGTSGTDAQFKQSVNYLKSKGVRVKKAGLSNPRHHLFHAMSAFYMSDFNEASCLVIDGAGSTHRVNNTVKANETTSIYELNRNTKPRFKCTYKHFTVGIYGNGGLKNRVENYPAIKSTLSEVSSSDIEAFNKRFSDIENIVTTTQLDTGIKYYCAAAKTGKKMGWGQIGCDGKLMGLAGYGDQPNATEEQILAYTAQKELEQDFINRIKYCKSNNIVISGGCALNILGNSFIKKTFPNINIFIDPIGHDGTIALGAAAFTFFTTTNSKDRLITSAYTGLNYNITKDDIYECVRKYSV